MTREQFLLTLVMEECAELAQRASKTIRFGPTEVQAGQTETNTVRFLHEYMDLLTVLDLLDREGHIKSPYTHEDLIKYMEKKQEKIEKYYQYSQSLGRVNGLPDPTA